MKKRRTILFPIVVSVAVAGWLAAQVPPPPPEGTIAAEMQDQYIESSPYGGVVDVTAVSTTLIAFDSDGHPVLDLRPDELQVIEDKRPVRLLGLEHGIGPVTAAAPGEKTGEIAASGTMDETLSLIHI